MMAANHRDQLGDGVMKKAEVKIGGVYYANVSGQKTRIRIDAEVPAGGWTATNVATGMTVRVKTAQRLLGIARGRGTPPATSGPAPSVAEIDRPESVASGAPATAPKHSRTRQPTAEPTSDGQRLSAISAAAKVLEEATEPLSVKQMVEAMASKGYWSSPGGKTPHATLHSAIQREIASKGELSRFVKTDRGRFVAANLAGVVR
jgi:hypothetical protein